VEKTVTWTATHNRIKVQCNPHFLKPGANTEETDTTGYKTQKCEMLVRDRGKKKST